MQDPSFSQRLLYWHATVDRDLPWKETADPYAIWISEIILQQTRVAQAIPYYYAFLENFPTVMDLAEAEEDQVFKVWQGLGYYSRARNLHFSAKYVVEELAGKFPATHEEILKLKGVGPYTAAAIASFAYGLPHAVLDGNVMRVLSRHYGIDSPIDKTSTKHEMQAIADGLLDPDRPAHFNQAMMDLGATICTPKKYNCAACPLQETCHAHLKGNQDLLPRKKKKIVKKTRFLNFIVPIDREGNTYLRKRNDRDIWAGLYEFPMAEASVQESYRETLSALGWALKSELIYTEEVRHILTHQVIKAQFFLLKVQALPANDQYPLHKWDNLKNFALPRLISKLIPTLSEKIDKGD